MHEIRISQGITADAQTYLAFDTTPTVHSHAGGPIDSRFLLAHTLDIPADLPDLTRVLPLKEARVVSVLETDSMTLTSTLGALGVFHSFVNTALDAHPPRLVRVYVDHDLIRLAPEIAAYFEID